MEGLEDSESGLELPVSTDLDDQSTTGQTQIGYCSVHGVSLHRDACQ